MKNAYILHNSTSRDVRVVVTRDSGEAENPHEDPAVLANRPGEHSKFVHQALKYTPLLRRMFARGKGLLHEFGYHNNARGLRGKW